MTSEEESTVIKENLKETNNKNPEHKISEIKMLLNNDDTNSDVKEKFDEDANTQSSINIESSSDVEMKQNETQSDHEKNITDKENNYNNNDNKDDEKAKEILEQTELALNNSNEKESNENLLKLLNNINYAIILAFLEKFGNYLTLKDYPFKSFESHLLNNKTCNLKIKIISILLLFLFFFIF